MKRKKIVVMGFMGGCPIAGVVWAHLHYIVGLMRLGHEVYYIEDSARYPYNPVTYAQDEDYSYAASFLQKTAAQFGFEGRWSYCARFLPGMPCAGLPKGESSSCIARRTRSSTSAERRSSMKICC